MGPGEQRQDGQSRLNSLSFTLPILSLCSSYANRLLTFVKIKRRGRRESGEERREREGDKTGLRAARKQSSSFLFLLRCRLSSASSSSSSSPLSSCYFSFFFSFLCDICNSVQLRRNRRLRAGNELKFQNCLCELLIQSNN